MANGPLSHLCVGEVEEPGRDGVDPALLCLQVVPEDATVLPLQAVVP